MTTLEPPTKAKATESFLCIPPDRHKKKKRCSGWCRDKRNSNSCNTVGNELSKRKQNCILRRPSTSTVSVFQGLINFRIRDNSSGWFSPSGVQLSFYCRKSCLASPSIRESHYLNRGRSPTWRPNHIWGSEAQVSRAWSCRNRSPRDTTPVEVCQIQQQGIILHFSILKSTYGKLLSLPKIKCTRYADSLVKVVSVPQLSGTD